MKDHAARRIALSGVLALVALPGLAAAQPMLCGAAAPVGSTDPLPVDPATLTGTYRCAEEGLEISLRLDANGRFQQRFEAKGGGMSDAERAEFAKADRVGRWRLEGRTVVLFESPEREPILKLVEMIRDPSVRMRVEVRQADGRPALGLFVGEGANANPQSQLDEGVLTIPRTYSWEPGLRQIMREGDDRSLASFTVTPDGPNIFRFIYTPSEVEPFEVRARVMDAAGNVIGVPLGISGALLKRTVPKR